MRAPFKVRRYGRRVVAIDSENIEKVPEERSAQFEYVIINLS